MVTKLTLVAIVLIVSTVWMSCILFASADQYFMALGGTGTTPTSTWETNFGSPAFSISSGNADANGHGNFEYSVPSGYFALCSKNLAEFG